MSSRTQPRPIETERLAAVTGGNNPFQNFGGGAGESRELSGFANDHTGTSGNDTIHADAGDDTVRGGDGADKITGNAGHDWLMGGQGADELHGDNYSEQWTGGNDGLDGGEGDAAADKAFAGGGNDSYTWRPGDGNDEFHGEGGTDTLILQGVGRDELANGLNLHQGGLVPKDFGNGYWGFVNGSGQVQTVSGTFTLGGETVTFYGTEYIKVG
jgi:Ca2+-binding RTX toxin-like protein